MFQYGIKIFVQTLQICYVLLRIDPPSYMLLQVEDLLFLAFFSLNYNKLIRLNVLCFSFDNFKQNPPGLPAIAVVWAVCLLRGSKFIIDWHNYGYTIMGLTHGDHHPIVLIAKW